MNILKNLEIISEGKKTILADVFYNNTQSKKPIVLFTHGFKGFKDWGHFNALGQRMAQEGMFFVKFNFSHNGTTIEQPDVFSDLEAFGNNNYSIELEDLKRVIDWISDEKQFSDLIHKEQLYLIGHSRGGGICILKAAEDSRVKKLVTWASVSDIVNRNKKKTIETWKRDGVVYATNSRTQQKMPLYYQFYEDQQTNKIRFNILQKAGTLRIPFLIIHGNKDEAVLVSEAHHLHKAARSSNLLIIDGANHTFEIKHPFELAEFSKNAELVISSTIEFFKE